MNQRGLVGLPRNWRVVTVASLTTLGLAYQAGQPARGDWWSLPKAKPDATKAAAAKPASPENGFSSTIHRLMSDARLYADKGELDKAVQLAERAAKISEASSQLLGPASDCSPEKTAQFVNELRTQRDAVAKRTAPASAGSKKQPRDVASASPSTEPLKRLVVERAIAEHAAVEQKPVERSPVEQKPAELALESREGNLAWAEELPPTPAPEAEPLSKPIKFRRSVLSRASQASDEVFEESRAAAEEAASAVMADTAIDELLEIQVASELPVAEETNVPSTAVANSKVTVNDPVPTPSDAGAFSLDGGIQSVATEVPKYEAAPQSTAPTREPGWEDEAFADVLPPASSPASQAAGTSAEREAPASKSSASPFPEDAFPVQRVVQLRRRLETATSLDPGAYILPSTSVAKPIRETDNSPSAEAEFELPKSVSVSRSVAPSAVSKKVKLKRELVTGLSESNLNEIARLQQANQSEVTPTERPALRLRENRALSGHVRTALLESAAFPSTPTTRKHAVGYSEPMLWQSANEQQSPLPTLSLANGTRNGTSGSGHVTGAAMPPDLREARSKANTQEGHLAAQRKSPTDTVEQTAFRSIELPTDSIPFNEPSGPELSSAQLKSPDSNTSSARNGKHSANRPGQKAEASSSKASDEVSRQSFALIEPLASALQLPIATTASLLGGAGLVLVGLGLLLVRAALRWRNS